MTWKSQQFGASGNQPGRRKHVRAKEIWTGRKRGGVGYWDWKLGKSFAHHTSCVWVLVYFVGRADFYFFVRFENTASCRCSSTSWRLSTLFACLRCRALIGRYSLCCVVQSWLRCAAAVLWCCAVLCCCACGRCSTTTCLYHIQHKEAHNQKKTQNSREKKMGTKSGTKSKNNRAKIETES